MRQLIIPVIVISTAFIGCTDKEPMPLRFIEGHINGKRTIYPQKDFINISPSNSYSQEFKSTWLQALNEKGHWYINLYDTPLDSIEVPYEVPAGKGVVDWNNNTGSRNENCEGIDAGCTYLGATGEDVRLTITELSSSHIAGQFSGKLILAGIGFIPFRDSSDFIMVTEGKFNIAYKVEP